MDRRTKRQKLEAMANQSVSPNEAEVAKEKLKDLPPDPEPQPAVFNIVINGNGFTYHGTGSVDFSDPFKDTSGEGVYVFDFVKNVWKKVG